MTAQTARRFGPRLTAVTAMAALAFSLAAANDPATAQTAGPEFADGQSQVVDEFADSSTWIRQELWVETTSDSDGDGVPDRVRVAVTRPDATDGGLDVPVVYETSPYYSGGAALSFWDVNHELGEAPPDRGPAPEPFRRPRDGISRSHEGYWVPRGYAVVHSEAPGTGLSQGCPTVGGRNETLAPKAVIDWLNGRAPGYTTADGDEQVVADWTTGKVGMLGTSYNGTLPIAAATTGVEGLEAIVPSGAISEWYQYYRNNGAVRAPGNYQGEDLDVLMDYIHTRENRQVCLDTVRQELQDGQDRVTGDYNELWDERNYLKDVDDISAATLVWHGLNDWNVMPQQAVQLFDALQDVDAPSQIYLHQGGHAGPSSAAMPIVNKWFTRYLWDHDNGVEDDPRALIVREGDSTGEPTGYATYPNPDMAPVDLNLQATEATNGRMTNLALGDDAELTLVDAGNQACQVGTLASEDSPHRLLFTTPVLTDDLHVSGVPEVTVRMKATAARANLSAALVRLPVTTSTDCAGHNRGSTNSVVTRGWTDPANRESLWTEQLLAPGEYVDVTFPLQGTDKVVAAGEQLALVLYSSDKEFTILPQPGTELTFDLTATSVSLPVVGGPLAMPVCPDVDERDTVIVAGTDTGVPNLSLAGNCTINDHILADQAWDTHGDFVDHVATVAQHLVDAGLLTDRQRGRLESTAARSDVGKSPAQR